MFPAVGARPVLCWCFLVFWKMPEPLNREIHDASTHSTSSWTVSLSQSLSVSLTSHCHSLSVQPELKRILCSRLVWNITYLTCWWIDGCSQLPPSLLCRLHSSVSLSAQDTRKDFSTSGKFETAACVYIGNDSPSGLWEESYRSQWEHCILSTDQ